MFPKSNIHHIACMVFDPNLVHVDPEHPAEIEDDVQLPDVVVVAPKENGLNIADVPTSEATPEEAAAKAHSSPAPVTPPTSRPNAELEVDLDMLSGERTEEK